MMENNLGVLSDTQIPSKPSIFPKIGTGLLLVCGYIVTLIVVVVGSWVFLMLFGWINNTDDALIQHSGEWILGISFIPAPFVLLQAYLQNTIGKRLLVGTIIIWAGLMLVPVVRIVNATVEAQQQSNQLTSVRNAYNSEVFPFIQEIKEKYPAYHYSSCEPGPNAYCVSIKLFRYGDESIPEEELNYVKEQLGRIDNVREKYPIFDEMFGEHLSTYITSQSRYFTPQACDDPRKGWQKEYDYVCSSGGVEACKETVRDVFPGLKKECTQ